MKAYLIRKYKASLELAEVVAPAVRPNDVLVKIAAASLNQVDEMLRQGAFKATLPYKMPLILGNDLAGEVVEVGSEVSAFKVGDLVFGKPDQSRIGTFAEFIAVDQADLALKPESLSMAEAAAVSLVGLTAWQALVERGNLQAGQKVLIHGGAGGVGSLAIQMAKLLGAEVATTVSAASAAYVRELGADIVIDYKTQKFAEILSGFDLVLDTQGGETLLNSLKVLRRGGKVVGITGPPDSGFARRANLNPMLRFIIKLLSSKVNKQAKALGVTYEFLFVEASGSQMAHLASLFAAQTIKPIAVRELAFADAPAALEALANGRSGSGKAVLVINSVD